MTASVEIYDGHEFEATANLVNYYNWITDGFKPYLGGAGTEIGAGVGVYSEYLRPHFSTFDVVEPSPAQLDELQQRFSGDGDVRVLSETIDIYHGHVGDASRDTICMVNVLEHIKDDIDALRKLRSMLRDGGHLCVFVPALPFLYSKYDAFVGHHRRYVKRDLAERMAAAGFEVVSCKYMDILGVPAWGVFNTLLGATKLNLRMTTLYDRAFVPVTRGIETLIPAPLGKNLLAVGRKNG